MESKTIPRIRVLHVHTMPVITGSGIETLMTMDGLDKNTYEVEFACAPGGALIAEVERAGIPFRPVPHLVQEVSPYSDVKALFELISVMKEGQYHIVHSHNSKAGFIARLAARWCKVPIVIHTVHGFSFHNAERAWRRKLFTWLERFAARYADKLVVVSNPLREWGLNLSIGRPEQYVTIYGGIEIAKFEADVDVAKKRKEFGIGSADKVVGVVSKLWEGKGHKDVLHAAKKIVAEIPDVKFMIVGEGYLQEELVKLTHELGLNKHVIFTGFRTDIAEINSTFDVAVLASYFEGMGRVLLEAMAVGKPIVATRVGGIVDVVDDSDTGILVPPREPEALAQALITLLRNKDMRACMGQAGKKKVDERFSADTMVSKIQDLYEELMVRKGITRDS